MMNVELYMEFKAQEREKLINEQKRKRKQREGQTASMSDEAYAKFTELQNRISTPIKKSKEAFSVNKVLSSLETYLENLPQNCKKLSDSDLRYELRRTEFSNKQAYEILFEELERRKQENKKNK